MVFAQSRPSAAFLLSQQSKVSVIYVAFAYTVTMLQLGTLFKRPFPLLSFGCSLSIGGGGVRVVV